jgi:hypothetical protein
LRLLAEDVREVGETQLAEMAATADLGPGERMVDGQRLYSAAWLIARVPADAPSSRWRLPEA